MAFVRKTTAFLLLYTALEFLILMLSFRMIGFRITWLILVADCLFGLALAGFQVYFILRIVRGTFHARLLPTALIYDRIGLVIAGILFFLPGFISDIAGICLLFSPVRKWIRQFLLLRFHSLINRNGFSTFFFHRE